MPTWWTVKLWNIQQILWFPDYFVRFLSALITGRKASVSLRGEVTLRTLGGDGNRVVFLPQYCFWFFFLSSCLMSSLIPPKEYKCRIDRVQTYSIPVNQNLQERPEMLWYTSSCLLSSWHTTDKMQVSRNQQTHLSWKLTPIKPRLCTSLLRDLRILTKTKRWCARY